MLNNNEEMFKKLKSPIKTKERPGKGGSIQTYVPVENVVERINDVFGLNWNFEILREGYNNSEVYAIVRIHYPLEVEKNDNIVKEMHFKDGVGGVSYEPAVGLGNNLKASVSLALVKAASLLGIDTSVQMMTEDLAVKIVKLAKSIGIIYSDEQKTKLMELTLEGGEKILNALQNKKDKMVNSPE